MKDNKKSPIQEQNNNKIKGSEDNLSTYPNSSADREDLTEIVTISQPDQSEK